MTLSRSLRLARLIPNRKERNATESDIRRMEERRRSLQQSHDQWRSLLRDMEHSGQSAEPQYESYYLAYLKAREQLKHSDLELFNVRSGFGG